MHPFMHLLRKNQPDAMLALESIPTGEQNMKNHYYSQKVMLLAFDVKRPALSVVQITKVFEAKPWGFLPIELLVYCKLHVCPINKTSSGRGAAW